MFQQIFSLPDLEKYDLSSLTILGNGATYLPPELRKRFQKKTPNALYFMDGVHRIFSCFLVPAVVLISVLVFF